MRGVCEIKQTGARISFRRARASSEKGVAERTGVAVTSRHMTLQERIDSELKDAMRAKDAAKLGVLRMLKSAIKNAAIEKGGASAIAR